MTVDEDRSWAAPPRILLCALDAALADAWRRQFDHDDRVEVILGSILDTPATAIVSPANSFGYMDGGLDLVYSKHFGWDLEREVRRQLLESHHGELAVGQAIVVPTGDSRHPYLVTAPTMRVPMDVSGTTNAFLAFKAVLRTAKAYNNEVGLSRVLIESIACPGLGTGEGRMAPDLCARQMRYAFDVVVEGRIERKGGLAGAVRNHLWLIGQEDQLG